MSWSQNTLGSWERPLGDSEIAFIPSNKTGLGDMMLHLGFKAPKEIMRYGRVKIAWAAIRKQHPLLRAKVVQEGNDLETARFSFLPCEDSQEYLDDADAALTFSQQTKDELISQAMNGPRFISEVHLSHLIISVPTPSPDNAAEDEYDLLMCAPHFIGDATSLHQSTHDLLAMLALPKSDEEFLKSLTDGIKIDWGVCLPVAMESRLAEPKARFGKAACRVNFLQSQSSEIGGHTFDKTPRGPVHTVFLEREFTEEQTVSILRKCKSQGVTVNHALSALCNAAWSKLLTSTEDTRLPMMMYTAINMRSFLTPHPAQTNWFISLTYFNIVLPCFLPASQAAFWLRVRQAKIQTARNVKSPFLISKALQMAKTRGSRARGLPPATNVASLPPGSSPPSWLPPAPSLALLGLSMIGNLDRTYIRDSYPQIQLITVCTASRLKASGMLLLEHTFAGKLWLQLFYDVNGFREGQVEAFWKGLSVAAEEYLC